MEKKLSRIFLVVMAFIAAKSFAQTKSSAPLLQSESPKTVIFITGAFVGNNCWDEWKTYFDSKGYKTIAPPWPYKDAPAAELRAKQPRQNPGLAKLTLEEVIDYYADIVKKCPEKPILIGHSFGGLITQVLINRDLATAGVAIHPVPPKGVLPYEYSFLRAGGKALGFFSSLKKTYLMSFKKWQYAFVNGLPLEEQKATYETYTIPESKRVVRGAIGKAAKVDFEKPHAPLLITSGSTDHIIPAHLNHRNFNHYKQNGSVTDYKEFEGRNHFVLGLPTWREDADYVLDWLDKHKNDVVHNLTQNNLPAKR